MPAAILHGAYWNDASLDTHPWLQGSAVAPPPALSMEATIALWTGFKDRYGPQLAQEDIEVGDAYTAALPKMQEIERPGPFALTHNDYRLDNMLFGKPGSPKPLAVVDWQTAGKACRPAMWPISLVQVSRVMDRPKHEQALLRYYHARLQDEGVTDYSFDALYDDYRYTCFYGMSVAYGAAMLVKQTERGDQMFLTMLRRHARRAGQ